jgi:hypothetical protein
MKSAWELALERSGGKLAEIPEEKKRKLAEIEARYRSKIAEAELSAEHKLAKADPAKRDEIKEGVANEIASLKDKCEREKEAVRKA